MSHKKFIWKFGIAYGVIFLLYSVWSYTQTDPNLVLTGWAPYWNWQLEMWQVDKHFVTQMYVLLIAGIFGVYFLFVKNSKPSTKAQVIIPKSKASLMTSIFPVGMLILILGILLFSYNALSHDVFNYIFNARMVVEYGVDPHVQTALQFANDDWTRFMHNVHTPAPYFYGWTGLSVVPYVVGLGKFTLTWLLFRLWSIVGLLLLVFVQFKLVERLKLGEKAKRWVWLFALNPLVLIEIVSNSHNDAWMMGLGLGSIFVITQISNRSASSGQDSKPFGKLSSSNQISKIAQLSLSLILLLLSISTKYVTVLLLPLWLFFAWKAVFPESITHKWFLAMRNALPFKKKSWTQVAEQYLFDLTAVLLFIPLLTIRSQQFHPWYLIWSLAFLPFLKLSWWRNVLLILSVSSLFRYVPWLWNGGFEFTPTILWQQKVITWMPVGIFILMNFSQKLRKNLLSL